MEIVDLESEAKIAAEETYEEMLVRNLEGAIINLELMKVASKNIVNPIIQSAATWYSGKSQEISVTRGYQYTENEVDWRLIISEDKCDPSLTKEAKLWLDFQDANYDVVTRAGLVLAAGVYGKNKDICNLCFKSAKSAIDKVEVKLHEDWQSVVSSKLFDETINSEDVVNPESVGGFSQVVSALEQKFPGILSLKINKAIIINQSSEDDSSKGNKWSLESFYIIPKMRNKGKPELADAMSKVIFLPQRNPVTVRVGADALPAKEDVSASPERLAEVKEKSDKNSTDDSLVAAEMHGVVPTEAQQNQAEIPQPNVVAGCITRLCGILARAIGRGHGT